MTAVLLVSFGTKEEAALRESIFALTGAVKEALPSTLVLHALTSSRVRAALAEKGIRADSLDDAVRRAHDAGAENLAVVPTFVVRGGETQKLEASLSRYGGWFPRIGVSGWLLSPESLPSTAKALEGLVERGREVVLVGHGLSQGEFSVQVAEEYRALERCLHGRGCSNAHVVALHGEPSVSGLCAALHKKSFRGTLVLQPLMVTAGGHVHGELPLLAEQFSMQGFGAECVFRGLCEYDEFRTLFAEKARDLAERISRGEGKR